MSVWNTLETREGQMSIVTFASHDDISRLEFDPQFGEHTGFRSLYTRGESLMMRSCEEDSNVVLAVRGETIVGFGLLTCPDPDQRWSRLGPKTVLEVKGIEVIRAFRKSGLGKVLVEGMLSHPEVEKRILYLVGYTWVWDLTGAGLTGAQYHRMMVRLFEPFGFCECKTNEPNICLDSDNLFMCRTGKNVSARLRDDFKWLCFGVYPQTSE
ncbi:MAG: GNAT family N-acetyltransferase [Syntrophobacteraceae bacterium]|nr:GNAT family N-acetyltransferase [Syntrophobacteraceae bacterium]